MTSSHIDQLREWWESAEKGAPSKGDAIIRRTERLLSNGYAYEVGTEDYTDAKHLDNVRILARAPKPKPAWHDAVAVIARVDDGSQTPDTSRVALLRDVNEAGQWVRGYCDNVYSDELFDVTPLIEAKVTDAMIDRILDVIDARFDNYPAGIGEDLAVAALGLESV